MKKCSSVVWRFFERIENENKRCLAVLCKLCDTQYKYFGNTTNLRSHLIKRHPLQWELSQNGGSAFEDSSFHLDDEESNQSAVLTKRRKYSKVYKDKNVRYSVSVENPDSPGEEIPRIEIQRVDVLNSIETDNEQNDNEENEATFNLVRQLHNSRPSDEEWLDEDPYTSHMDSFERKRKKIPYRVIKREPESPPRRVSTFKPRVKHYESTPIVVQEPANTRDEYSVFGEYVANKLRKFKAPRTRGNLQQLITTILWQAEYGTYDSTDAVKRVLMLTVEEPEPEHSAQVLEEMEPLHTEDVVARKVGSNHSAAQADSLSTIQ